MITQVKWYTILFLVAIIYYSASTLKYVSEIISQSFKKKNYKKYTSILSYIHFVSPVPYKTLHMAHIELEHFDDFCVCVWERPRGWGGQDFPLPLLPVCRNREKRESIMQIMSTPFSQKSLPPIGTASGELRTAQQLYEHGTSTLGTPPNPNAKCKVRALPSACPRAGSTTDLQVWQSLPLPPIRAPGTTRSSLRGRCWWSLSGLVRAL